MMELGEVLRGRRGQPSPIGVGFVFVCDGCGSIHLFGLDAVNPIEVLASWGWRMAGWGRDLCPECVEAGIAFDGEDE